MTFPEDEKSLPGDLTPSEPGVDQPEAAPREPEMASPLDGQVPPFPTEADALPEFDFPRMEEDVAAFHRELDELHFAPAVRAPVEEPVRAEAPRRRRRPQRIIERPEAGELGERLASIAARATPTFDFFVFSFLSGCLLGLGYILDAPAILLFGILAAPVIAPWVGVSLAAATGEMRFLGQTLGGFVSALAMVFVVGLLAGFSSRIFQPLTSSQAFLHSRLWWPDLLMLITGTMILVIAFIQSETKPALASLMVAYELYLPISAAGFGLGSGVVGLWPAAGLVFLIHLSLSLIISLIVFFYMGFRPLELSGYALAAGIVVVSLAVVAGFVGLGSLMTARSAQTPVATPLAAAVKTSTPSPVPSEPVSQATVTVTLTLAPSTPTLSSLPAPVSTQKLPATPTLGVTPSPTLLPTPVYGRVQARGTGATIRVSPGGAAITTIQNGYLVEILGDAPALLEGATWIHVIVKTPSRDIDGWMLLDLITTATPSGSP
jgi:uncharacterized membrane protein